MSERARARRAVTRRYRRPNGRLSSPASWPNFLSLSVSPPPLLGGGGSCSRESLISAGPACSNTCYRVSLRSLAETSVAAEGGLWKGVHSGKNCILVYNAKAVPPPVSGSCEPYFRPTLSAADNHASLENRNKHHQRYQKKGSPGFQSSGT